METAGYMQEVEREEHEDYITYVTRMYDKAHAELDELMARDDTSFTAKIDIIRKMSYLQGQIEILQTLMQKLV